MHFSNIFHCHSRGETVLVSLFHQFWDSTRFWDRVEIVHCANASAGHKRNRGINVTEFNVNITRISHRLPLLLIIILNPINIS